MHLLLLLLPLLHVTFRYVFDEELPLISWLALGCQRRERHWAILHHREMLSDRATCLMGAGGREQQGESKGNQSVICQSKVGNEAVKEGMS